MQLQVNLLPKEHRPKPAVRIWPVLLTVIFALNIVGMGTWWLFLQLDLVASATDLVLKSNEVVKLEEQVREAEAGAVLQTEVAAKREFIANSIAGSRCWHPLLLAIERSLVPEVTILGIVGADSGDVAIGGETDTVKSVADFMGSLQAETGLPVVRVGSVTPEGPFNMLLMGWSGREVLQNE